MKEEGRENQNGPSERLKELVGNLLLESKLFGPDKEKRLDVLKALEEDRLLDFIDMHEANKNKFYAMNTLKEIYGELKKPDADNSAINEMLEQLKTYL